MGNYERRSSPVISLWVGLVLGNVVGGVIAHTLQEDPDSRVRNVQTYNGQLSDQLKQAHTVGNLILNDQKHAFTFDSRATDGAPETCSGKYEVQNRQAHVIGDLACTQTVVVTPTN